MSDDERTTKASEDDDLAALIVRIKASYNVTDSDIARAIGVHVGTVNSWVHRRRGTGRGPKVESLRALAAAYPKFAEDQIFAAAGRRRPGPLGPDAEQRILELYRGLTEQQQQITETQMRALRESNHQV